jgi:peptidyl-prolyl cis-trans isomerase D
MRPPPQEIVQTGGADGLNMLQSLRKSAASFVIKLLAGLLVASFAVWGISDTYIFGQVGDTVAEVGKREIKVPTLQRAFRQEVDRLRQYNIDEQRAREMGLLDQTLNRLVTTALIDSAAGELGMVVGKSSLREQIRKQFGGTIDSAQFQNILRNNGLSESQFLAQLGGQIVRTQFLESLTMPARAPNQLAERLYRWREEKREADWFTVPVNPRTPMRAPSDAEIDTYYKANQNRYQAPEYRATRYVHLDPAVLAKDITVSDEKLKAAYEDRLTSLSVPERRTVMQMLLPDRVTADKARTRLGAGEAFIAVAKDLAGQEEDATRLGTLAKTDLPSEIAEPAFKLSKGAVSEPVEGPFGLLLLTVTDIKPGKTPTLDEVRKTLRADVAKEEAIDAVFEQANRLEEAIGGGAKLEEAARELGLSVRTVEALDAQGRDRSDKTVTKLPDAPFLKTLFETSDGETSLLTEAASNTFFILHVDSTTPSKVRPLNAVRDQAREDWKQEERWKAARAKGKTLVEQLNAGRKIAGLAKKSGYKLRASGAFNRAGQGLSAGMSPALAADMFEVKSTGHAAMADGRDGVHVAQLKTISKAAADSDRKGVDALAVTLRAGIAGDVAGQLDKALRKRHDVTIDQRVLQYNFYRDAGDS